MQVVILCGGKGIRIRDLNDELPKPMIPIRGLPILYHIMNIYSHYGFKEFILCLGYKKEKIIDFIVNLNNYNNDIQVNFHNNEISFINKKNFKDWKVKLIDTGLENQTGSRLHQIKKYIKEDKFFVTYGDGVADINILKLLNFHKKKKKIATITTVKPIARFGEIKSNLHGKVTSFQEKPQSSSGIINGGFMVFDYDIFNYISKSKNCSLEFDVLSSLSNEGQLMNYFHKGFWMPMDTHREYILLNKSWNKKK